MWYSILLHHESWIIERQFLIVFSFCCPSRDLLQPEALEEVVVGVCLKQYGLESALRLLRQPEAGGGARSGVQDHHALLEAIFTRVNGLERRLQVWGNIALLLLFPCHCYISCMSAAVYLAVCVPMVLCSMCVWE